MWEALTHFLLVAALGPTVLGVSSDYPLGEVVSFFKGAVPPLNDS